ncbi:MAG: ABC transporter substrate-binding protein [Dehalococcoidia bacterium]|nr:ABC transporter substrate-binding protein [Dehalococcoidia bacterium]
MPTVRRGPLTVLLLAGVILIALGWLRAGGSAQPADRSYVEATLGRADRVDPLAAHTTDAERDLASLVFGGLMRLRADGTPEPELAERWEVTPDGLTFTFHLRTTVTWHDGAAFDAEDVAFTIERIQAETFQGSQALATEWRDVQVFVADSLTVMMRLPEPAADFLVRASVGILPEHLRDQMATPGSFETAPFDRAPVGTGPYRLTALRGDRAVLEHNTSYVLGTPAITRLELRFAADAQAQAALLRSGEADGGLLPAATREEEVASLVADTGLEALPLHGDSYTVLYINNDRDPLRAADLRRALAASIRPAEALEEAGQQAIPGQGVVFPGSWALPPDGGAPEPPDVDLDALWAAAQWPLGADGLRARDGLPLHLELVTNGEPDRLALAQAIADQLAEQGVTVEVVGAPSQRVIGEYLRPGNYDLALFGWDAAADPDPYAGWHTSQGGAGNVAWFSDPEADALLEAARTTMDMAERSDLYALFLDRFEALGASRVVAYPQRVYLHPERMAGLEPRLLSTAANRLDDVHRWRLP